ncbi:MAG: site-specific DNA-methyltransferase [SAR202 cluster bacterium]|jgi:adenine-specific DNA-methyltransferase|nr:site-specific DNA-methyltransferase [SAR202 cluster bacterium]
MDSFILTGKEFSSLTQSNQSRVSILRAIEGHVVIEDCLRVLKRFPDDCVDLIHTSPPYNIDKPYEESVDDNATHNEYRAFLNDAIHEFKRVLKPGGSIFWQTGYTQASDARSAGILPIDIISYPLFVNGDIAMNLWDRIIWRYFGGHAFKRKFTNKHETIMWYVKPGAEPFFDVDEVREKAKEYDKRNNFWGRNPGNVWEIDRIAAGSTEQTSHIAVFPELLSEKIIRACSRPGDLILDPFSGSGTVPKVARSLSRKWVGIETSRTYAEQSSVRIGFQQPSELDSLASEKIKRLAFQNRKTTLATSEIASTLKLWASETILDPVVDTFSRDVSSALDGQDTARASKKAAWEKYDRLINGQLSADAVVDADSLLLRSYKNRHMLNGVSRYKSALEILQRFVSICSDSDERLRSEVTRIAQQEPSSFDVVDGQITLKATDRRINVGEFDETRTLKEKMERSGETLQGRLSM